MSKKRNWRGVSDKVAKDKQEIYNSREWKELRTMKLRANPLCEMCIREGEAHGIPGGYITPSRVVHHRHPIEDSTTKAEMRKWAFMWNNLEALCQACHAKAHKEMGSNTRRMVAERAEARQARWKDGLLNRFTSQGEGDQEGDGM